MSVLRPFRGLRPPGQWAPEVAAPPYDVVSAREARACVEGKPRSFFHISRPEVDLPPSTGEHADVVYRRGLENLRRFREQGWLRPDPSPCFYAYRQRVGSHVQVGLVAVASVDEYDRGAIKKHELTRADKEDDRTRHLEALGGNDEPVFLTYRAVPAIDALIAQATSAVPDFDFTTEDGIVHTFWTVPAPLTGRIEAAFRWVPSLYIADGHHRSAAASRVHQRLGASVPASAWFLAVVFPHDQLQILDYNRVVRDLHGLGPEGFLERVRERFELLVSEEKKPRRPHDFGMLLGSTWYRLRALPGSFPEAASRSLDVTLLQKNLLEPILGIGDPRTDLRIHFVGGIRGMGELEKLVSGGEFQVAFSLFPTTLDQLITLSDAGELMPPKSTWFEPKLRSGLVLHLYADQT
ncbi:MAG: DUF1015 family protein [Myxococcota bacterium]|nr:DUF1015 family protein [Myxococcota bacterium]